MNKTLTKLLALLGVFLFLGGGSVWGADPEKFYIRGASFNNWADGSGAELPYIGQSINGEAIYSARISSIDGQFKLSASNNNWDLNFGSDTNNNGDTKVSSGSVVTLKNDKKNLGCSSTLTNVTVTFYYNGANKDARLQIEPDYYLIGDETSSEWNLPVNTNSQYKFIQNPIDPSTFTLILTDLKKGKNYNYKIAPADVKSGEWSKLFTSEDATYRQVDLDSEKSLLRCQHEALIINADGNITITFKKTATDSGSILVEEFPKDHGFYLRGELPGVTAWTASGRYRFQTTDNVNYYLYNVDIEAGKPFKIGEGEWNNKFTYSSGASSDPDYVINMNNPYPDMSFSSSVKNATLVLNIIEKTLKVLYAKEPQTVDGIYVMGVGNELNENTLKYYPKTTLGNGEKGYTFTVENLEWFRVSTENSTDPVTYSLGAVAPVLGGDMAERPFGNGVIAERGRTLAVVPSPQKIMMPWKGKYTITIDERLTTINVKTNRDDQASKDNVIYANLFLVDDKGDVFDANGVKFVSTKEDGYYDKDVEDYPNNQKFWRTLDDWGISFERIQEGNEAPHKNQFITSLYLNTTDRTKPNYFETSNGQLYFYVVDNGTRYSSASSPSLNGSFTSLSANNNGKSNMPSVTAPAPIFVYYTHNNNANPQIKFTSRATNDYPMVTGDPEKLYLFGHLNDQGWNIDNYYTLNKDENRPGVYMAEDVDIRGSWNDSDVDQVGARILYNSSGDENYVTFYASWPGVDSNGNVNDKTKKLSTLNTNTDGEINILVYNDFHRMPVKYVENSSSNNFMVSEGIYYVEVNLNDMTIIFQKKPEGYKKQVEMEWYVGGDENNSSNAVKAKNQTKHSFKATGGVMQVGVEEKPTHRVARQVVYDVVFTPAGVKNNITGKRKADEVTKDGNTVSGPEDAASSVTFLGDESYNSNHLIQFNSPGTYTITPRIYSGATGLTAYEVAEMEQPMTVYVDENTTLAAGGTTEAPFGTKGTTIFTDLFEFENELTYGEDFTVNITAVDPETWVTGTDIETGLTEGFSGTGLLHQYEAIMKVEGSVVDGYYDAEAVAVEGAEMNSFISETSSYSYDLKLNVPCTGTYKVTIEPTKDGSHNFNPQEMTLTVYPNLTGVFGNDGGFNIEGYTFDIKNPQTVPVIDFPKEEGASYGSRYIAYCPGTYFATYFSTQKEATMAAYEETYKYAYFTPVDLSTLSNYSAEGPMDLNIYVSKNNVNHAYVFRIVPTTSSNNVSTGVEAIGGEEGEAEYFNLQGVKVQNPEHGIYVKVVNGKATKVIL